MSKHDHYGLKKPCANCPFLKDRDKAISLREGRVPGIVEDLLTGRSSSFSCHKTLKGGKATEMQCAGSLIMMEKLGRPTQLMRVMERLKAYNPKDFEPAWDLVIGPDDLEDL